MRPKREKFVILAEKRVSRALKEIQLIGNLSNTSNYDYSADDIREIFAALEQEIKGARKRFDGKSPEKEYRFQLSNRSQS